MEGRWAGYGQAFAWLGTLVFDELEWGMWQLFRLTHYISVTCDLACETFDRPSYLIYLTTITAWSSKTFFDYSNDGVSAHLKTTTPIAAKRRAGQGKIKIS
jgi:hypothetical protein